jgi:hypothetical protein
MNAYLRPALAAAIVWYALGMPGLPSAGKPGGGGSYVGPMSALHTAASSMPAREREVLSEALAAAGEMLAGDVQGLVANTEGLQRYIKAVTEFDYIGIGKPTAKYPGVASALQSELSKVIGSDVAPVTASIRSSVSAALTEAGKAVR